MIKSSYVLIALLLTSMTTYAELTNNLMQKNVVKVWSEKNSADNTVSIMALARYSNDCFAQVDIFKHREIQNSDLNYRIYYKENSNKICTKIFKPVDKIFKIDEVPSDSFINFSKIKVNEVEIE